MSNNERKEEMDRKIVLEVAKIFSFVKKVYFDASGEKALTQGV